jgi:hypothetical protein
LGLGLSCAAVWTLLWPALKTPTRTAVAVLLALLVTILSPVAAVLPGHPIVGLGWLWYGGGWVAIATFFVVTVGLASALVHPALVSRFPHKGAAWLGVLLLGCVIGGFGHKLDGGDKDRGRIAGHFGAMHTTWGSFPANDDEVISRVEKIGKVVKALAGGDDGIDTVVFPESIIGIYEPGTHAVIKREVLRGAAAAGQTVIVGADLPIGGEKHQTVALVFRPDGSSSYIAARQTTPLSQWRPWSSKLHYPADWLGKSVTDVGSGVAARIMICHEEFMPVLHLLSEAFENQQLVITLANRSASNNELSSTIQSAHTEGMARLFGRKWLRSVNGPTDGKKG